ncbi:serine hydrolase domain-containing protein [Ilumatobacter nonamiensis]|uniref:serine hydrolase domain-containing protein n=1 Tax=Ilumatobacter nonamiensis TaxID=467093 RepID=UPI0011D27312|nr:serine hydrolase [Ilumatobacter nonamiensis]
MGRRRPLVLAVAAGLLVASCASSDGDGSDAVPDSGAVATDPGPDTEPAASGTDAVEIDDSAAATSEPADTEPTTSEPEPSDPPASDPPTDDDDEDDDVDDFSAIDPIVSAFVAERGLNGAGLVVVDEDDGIIHEEYWGEFGPDRISLIASSSKMLTAGVLMRLADDGLLDMDAPVAAVAEWGAGNPDVTPAQLVSNSSGLVGLLPEPAYAPYICQYLAVGTLQDCAATIFTTADDDADVVAPDTEFRYGGAQWQVAGAVAEVASGKSWAELVDEIYVQPCDVDSLAYNNHFGQIGSGGFDYPVEFASDPSTLAPTDNPNMEGGVYITAPDYAELLLMQLRDGECAGGQVLSEEAVDRMHADRIAEAYDGSAGDDTGYGMGWWVDRESGRISDGGAYGSVPWLDLDEEYGAYLVVEADSGTGNELAALLYEPVAAAVDD